MSYGSKSITEWVDEITAWGKSKGWDKPPLCKKRGRVVPVTIGISTESPPTGVKTAEVLAKVMLVTTELAEAVEEAREGRFKTWYDAHSSTEKPEGFTIELADAVIRIFHIAGLLGLDLEGAIRTKMAYNERRAYRHGGKKA